MYLFSRDGRINVARENILLERSRIDMIYFGANEAARHMGISRQRLGVLLRAGRIQGAFNAGGHIGWQIPKAALMIPVLAKFKAWGNVGETISEDAEPAERRKPGRPRKIISA